MIRDLLIQAESYEDKLNFRMFAGYIELMIFYWGNEIDHGAKAVDSPSSMDFSWVEHMGNQFMITGIADEHIQEVI